MRTIAIFLSLSLIIFQGNANAGDAGDTPSETAEATAYEQHHGQLNVLVEGLDAEKGGLKVLLFNRETGFPTQDWNAVYAVDVELASGKESVVFESIPFGDYAIFIYHDENGNGKFDKNWAGAAKEGFGYSNRDGNSRVTPLYSQSKFNFAQDGSNVTIEMVPAK